VSHSQQHLNHKLIYFEKVHEESENPLFNLTNNFEATFLSIELKKKLFNQRLSPRNKTKNVFELKRSAKERKKKNSLTFFFILNVH